MSVSLDTPSDYTFFWYAGSDVKVDTDFADTDQTLTGLDPGHYTVRAINNIRHCEIAPQTVTIISNAPVINFTQTNIVRPSTCNDSNGSLTIEVSAAGNGSGFDFEWRKGQAPFLAPALTTMSNTANTTNVSALTTGVYTLIATNRENGCVSSHVFDLPFDDAQILSLVSKDDIESCTPGTDGAATVKLTKTVGFFESDYRIDVYEGTNDLGPSATVFQTMATVNGTVDYTMSSPLQPGSYTFVAVTINPVRSTYLCRSVPVTVTLLKNTPLPVFTANAPIQNMSCSGVSATGQLSVSLVSPTSNTADYTFDWFEGSDVSAPVLGTGTTGVKTGVNGEAAKNLPAGKYTVLVTKISGASAGCSSTATYQIYDNLPLISLATADISVSDVTRCDMMNSGSVTVNFVSENGIKHPAANYDFAWFSNAPAGPQLIAGATTNELINQPAGKYFVQPVNKTSNCSTGELIEINILDKTATTVSVTLTGFVTPTECLKPSNTQGEFEVLGAGTSASGYTYRWFAGNSTTDPLLSGPNIGGPNGEIAQNLISGVYTIEVTNNTTQCRITDTYALPSVKQPLTISASAEPLTVCYSTNRDGSVFAVVTSGSQNEYTYSWYAGTLKASPDFTSAPNSPAIDLSPGAYIVMAIDKLDATCFVSDTVVVQDKRITPVATALALRPVGNCDPARPNGIASVSVNGDFINYAFEWYASVPPAGPSFYTGPQVGGLRANTYAVVATSLSTGCADTTQVKIEMDLSNIPLPAIEVLSIVTSCVEGNGMLTASVDGNTSDYVFDWYVGAQKKGTPDFTGEIFDNLQVGTYSVTATSRITGCTSPLVSDDLGEQLKYPEFNFTTSVAMCRRDDTEESTGLAAVFVTNGVDIGSITWSGNGSNVDGPILSGVDAGIYTVTVTTTLGCSTTEDVEIKAEIRPFNGISRNYDGKNDLFHINCIESFPSNSVKIFNRAGTLVYEAEGYDNNGVYFDGKSNKGISLMGNTLPGGTYFYIIDKHDGTKPIAGYIELIN